MSRSPERLSHQHACRLWFLAAATLAIASLPGCAAWSSGKHDKTSRTASGADNPAQNDSAVPVNGYALLHDVVSDEKNLSLLRFIKHEAPALKALCNEIAQTNRWAAKALEGMAKTNSGVNLKDLGLPVAEMAARKAISDAKQKALLSGKGKQFQLELLLSQYEGLNYGANLAAVTAVTEGDSAKRELLQRISSSLRGLHSRVYSMISSNYSALPEK